MCRNTTLKKTKIKPIKKKTCINRESFWCPTDQNAVPPTRMNRMKKGDRKSVLIAGRQIAIPQQPSEENRNRPGACICQQGEEQRACNLHLRILLSNTEARNAPWEPNDRFRFNTLLFFPRRALKAFLSIHARFSFGIFLYIVNDYIIMIFLLNRYYCLPFFFWSSK